MADDRKSARSEFDAAAEAEAQAEIEASIAAPAPEQAAVEVPTIDVVLDPEFGSDDVTLSHPGLPSSIVLSDEPVAVPASLIDDLTDHPAVKVAD